MFKTTKRTQLMGCAHCSRVVAESGMKLLVELLRGVQGGNRYTITLRGEAVADLVPAQGNKLPNASLVVDEMRSFMHSRKQPMASVDLKTLINEGRA